MSLSHLKFFDKSGNNITPEIDNGVFRFNIFFNQVSTGLFESEHLFLLEEVLHEKEGLNLNSLKKGAYTPLLIRIMRYIRDWGGPIRKEKLNIFFPTLSIENDYVGNFINKNNNLISSIFDGDYITYVLTSKGETYLNDYDTKEQITWLDNDRKIVELTRPRSNYDINNNEDTYLFFRWRIPEKNDKNIFIYYIDNSDTQLYYEGDKSFSLDSGKKLPAIVPVYSSDIEPDNYTNPDWQRWFQPYKFDDGTGDSFLDRNDDNTENHFSHRVISSDRKLNQKPFQLNFALNSDVEGVFMRVLDLFIVRTVNNPNTGKLVSTVNKFAEIVLHGEVVGEDERFKLLLENFGRNIDENDSYIFRDTDTDEHLPDYIKINEKRKELLLVGEDIYNYIGSYKAFVNAMKFFGYQDLRLKEYFVNTQLSNPAQKEIYYSAVEIPLDLQVNFDFSQNKDFNQLIFGSLIDNKIYQKTSRFGLFYDINKVTDDVDDYGFPIVIDEFAFTNEEILIKLYGLKKVLQKYFLPHHARIIDITGEGIYFAKFKMNTWIDENPIISLKYDTNPDFIAEPLVGEIKHLDNLLNIFRLTIEEINDVSILNEDELVSNVINKSLSDFIKSNTSTFEFDEEVSLEVIKRFYPDYWSLKKAVFNHLKNSRCPINHTNYSEDNFTPIYIEKQYNYQPTGTYGPTGTYNEVVTIKNEQDNILYQAFEHSIKMLGQPVLIKTLPFNIKWDDMSIRYDYLENELGPVDIGEELLNQLSQEEIDRFDWFHIPIDDRIILRRLLWSGSRLFTWDNIGYFGTQWMQWYIKHESSNYCYKEEGLVSKAKEILVFLPHTGKYDVTLTMRDYNNFPRIRTKKKYIEVVKKAPDFVAIGRYVNKGNYWMDYNETNWDNFTGIWDYNSYCQKETTWDDSTIIWDDTNYSTYQSQFFTKELFESDIIDYDTNNYTIKIRGLDFINNYDKYSTQKWRNVLVTERYPEDIPTQRNVGIQSITNKTITLNGVYDILIGEKINLYKHYITNQMVVSSNSVDVLTQHADAFNIKKTFNLLHGSTLDYEEYIIDDVFIDYTKNLINLKVEDDGSLLDIPHTKIEFRDDDNLFRILTSIKDYNSNTTTITVADPNGYLNNIIKNGLNLYKAEWGIFSGRYVFDIIEVIQDSHDTFVRVKPNNNICNINTSFKVKWALDYDFDYAERYGSSTNYYWDNYDIKFDDMSNQSWDMLEYHNTSITGFKIQKITRNGWIKFNDELFEFDIPSIVPLDSMWNYLCSLLSNSEQKYVKDFYYNVIDNMYIQATSKLCGIDSYIPITSSGNIQTQNNTYPKANFEYWKNKFYNGYNNPAKWNYLNQGDDKMWQLTGAFNLTDSFITSKDMILPIATTLFVIFSDPDSISIGNKYSWELWEDNTNKLLLRSDYRYFVWNFVDTGNYSVKLTFTDDNSNTRIYKKSGWIKIV